MRFDYLGLLVGLGGIVCEDRGAEISVVDRVMYRDGELKAGLVGKDRTSNTGPHRLKKDVRNILKIGNNIRVDKRSGY